MQMTPREFSDRTNEREDLLFKDYLQVKAQELQARAEQNREQQQQTQRAQSQVPSGRQGAPNMSGSPPTRF